jgi:hypothetical protein
MSEVRALGATQVVVGLSALVRITPPERGIADTMKIVAGSGTLWVSPLTPAALSGTSGAAFLAVGYPLGATEVFNIGGPAQFYLSAASATMTVAICFGYSSGASLT